MSSFENACADLPVAAQLNLERLAEVRKQPLEEVVKQLLLDGASLVDTVGVKSVSTNGKFMRPPEAGEYLGVSVSQLAKMRCSGLGPRFVKLSHKVVGYWETDLISWLENRARTSTSDVHE